MKTVLIIDDDPDDIRFLCTAIHFIDGSVNCVSAGDGQQALELLRDGVALRPQYIFLDLNMPGLSGKECLRQIKNISGFENIPVIVYSTSKLKENLVEGLKMSAVYFLTKPTKLSVLKKFVSNILEEKWELI